MNDEILFVLQMTFPAERVEEVERLLRDLIDVGKDREPELLGYEFFVDDVQNKMYAFERYKDSAAVFAHMEAAGETLNQLHEAVEFTRVEVFGDVSAELAEALEPFKANILKHWGGFTR